MLVMSHKLRHLFINLCDILNLIAIGCGNYIDNFILTGADVSSTPAFGEERSLL